MPMELVFVIGMAVLLILCIKVKANAFISLLATALVMGMLSGMSGADTVSAITSGFSGTVKSIGIVIIFGIMLGNYLDAAKGTNRMAYDAVKLVGQKRAGLAMAITGYIVSIPVFSDAAFVILTPLVKAIHKKTKIPLAILAVSLSAGLLSTHVFVPPTPGPLAAAGLLGIDIGRAILYGDKMTDSMKAALNETNRRRQKREDFNREHGIVPQGVKKAVREIIDGVYRGPDVAPESSASDALPMDEKTLSKRLRELEEEMMSYAKNLDFEKAARVREELMALRKQAFGASAPA